MTWTAPAGLSAEVWFRCRRSDWFRSVWDYGIPAGSYILSAVRDLCKHAAFVGVDRDSIRPLITAWLQKHHLDSLAAADMEHSVSRAWTLSAGYRAQIAELKANRKPRATANIILDVLAKAPTPLTAGDLAEMIGCRTSATRMQLSRLTRQGKIRLTHRGHYFRAESNPEQYAFIGECYILPAGSQLPSVEQVTKVAGSIASHLLSDAHWRWTHDDRGYRTRRLFDDGEQLVDLCGELRECTGQLPTLIHEVQAILVRHGRDLDREIEIAQAAHHIAENWPPLEWAGILRTVAEAQVDRQKQLASFFTDIPACLRGITQATTSTPPAADPPTSTKEAA